MSDADDDVRLTQEQAAAFIHKGVRVIYEARRRGELKYLPGRPIIIRLSDLKAYEQEQIDKCHGKILVHISIRGTGDTSKSDGRKRGALSARQRAQRILAKHNRFSLNS